MKNIHFTIRRGAFGQFIARKFTAGFTLIETMVAVSLLSIAIVAPMSLTAQSLASAYYARDQITAFYLAQEAIEGLRSVRDAQILQIAQSSNGSLINLFGSIPLGNQPFIIDARSTDPAHAISTCAGGPAPTYGCPKLETDGTLYGYYAVPPSDPPPSGSGWTDSVFTRVVRADYVPGTHDEIQVSVTVSWQTESFQTRSFTITSNLYRWVVDGSSAPQ